MQITSNGTGIKRLIQVGEGSKIPVHMRMLCITAPAGMGRVEHSQKCVTRHIPYG